MESLPGGYAEPEKRLGDLLPATKKTIFHGTTARKFDDLGCIFL